MHHGFSEGNFLKVGFSWKEHISSFVTLGGFVYLKITKLTRSEKWWKKTQSEGVPSEKNPNYNFISPIHAPKTWPQTKTFLTHQARSFYNIKLILGFSKFGYEI
jgi:hypothetical protein